jgi:hypothetical protein
MQAGLVSTRSFLNMYTFWLKGVTEYRSICQDLHKTVALTQVSLITLEERLMNLEKLSHNGLLISFSPRVGRDWRVSRLTK